MNSVPASGDERPQNNRIDIDRNRKSSKYSPKELAWRIAWGMAIPFFKYSPRICFGWRRLLLRCFGAKIGKQVHIYPSVNVYFPWNLEVGDQSAIGDQAKIYNLGRIEIGANSTISQGSHLCAGTHDFSKASFPLVKSEIIIGNNCWICADAFIGPAVTIGENSIIGARSVVVSDVPANVIVAGNPAKFIKPRPAIENE